MSDKVALITGVTGQDGAYFAELLLSKGYVVHGVKRRSSSFNTDRIDHLYHDPHVPGDAFFIHYGDMTDATNLIRIIQEVQPAEIYNLAAQSHVQVSFETPEYTANADALGTLRLLEAIRILGLEQRMRFYQASTSELYGNTAEIPQNEMTPFCAAKPLRVRQALCLLDYGELPRGVWHSRVERNSVQPRKPDPRRDFCHPQNHARRRRDSSRAAEAALHRQSRCQARLGSCTRLCGRHVEDAAADQADDYVLATGEGILCANSWSAPSPVTGREIVWRGKGGDETGVDAKTSEVLVSVDPRYFRPTEVDALIGDASKARKVLGWKHRTSFAELVKEMVDADLEALDGKRLSP